MHVIEWNFLPAAGREDAFVAAYGPAGDWVKLFRQGDGYLGTELLPLPERPGWYRTIDRWTSLEAYGVFRRNFAVEYAELDVACEMLTASEEPVAHP